MRLFLMTVLIGGAIAGRASADDPKVDGKKLKVEVAKAKVTINGQAVAIPGELAAFEKAFGKPSGTIKDPVSDTNKYIYWKDLGVRCSQSTKGKQQVQELQLDLEPAYDLSAKAQAKPFPGRLTIEGVAIGATTPRADVKKLKLGREAFGAWQIDYEESPLQVVINPGEKGTKSVTILQPLSAR